MPTDPLGHAERSKIADPQMAFEKAGIHALMRIGEVQHCIEPEAKRQPSTMKKSAGERRNKCAAAIQCILLLDPSMPEADAATPVAKDALPKPCSHNMFKASVFGAEAQRNVL